PVIATRHTRRSSGSGRRSTSPSVCSLSTWVPVTARPWSRCSAARVWLTGPKSRMYESRLATLKLRPSGASRRSQADRLAFAVAISVLSTRNHGGASSSWLGAVAALTFELTFELVTIMIVCNHTVHRRTDEIDRPDPLPRRSHMTDTATPTGTLSAAEADAF